jgi:peroxiredoxin Q/BCP
MTQWLMLAALAALAVLLWRIAGRAKRNLPRAGEAAPDFSLPEAAGGRLRALADFRGRWLVLYFFPRADTPG